MPVTNASTAPQPLPAANTPTLAPVTPVAVSTVLLATPAQSPTPAPTGLLLTPTAIPAGGGADTPAPTPTLAPTLTGTPPNETATAAATATTTAAMTATPTPTPSPAATATAPPGWSTRAVTFAPDPDQAGSWLVIGELFNNTGAAQTITNLAGQLLDGQNQVAANASTSYLPVEWVLAGEAVPFELTVNAMPANPQLRIQVDASPAADLTRPDFTWTNLTAYTSGPQQCVRAQGQNPGEPLNESLVVTFALYDGQDRLIGFADTTPPVVFPFASGAAVTVDVCATPLGAAVINRQVLRAWGR